MNAENLKKWLWIVFISTLFLFFLFFIIGKIKRNKEEKREKHKTESLAKAKVTTLPAMYTEYYLLKKGEVIRVKVPSGYRYTCSGGGKKYYHQAQNTSKPEIWGDGIYHKAGEHVAYFDLSYYDEEITVVCEFKKL